MTRRMTAKCEVCGLVPPRQGVGFPVLPGAIPGLPEYLRGAILWICHAPACDLAAQKRAAAAAAREGITLTEFSRVHVFDRAPAPTPESET